MITELTERQEIALDFDAKVDGISKAEQTRRLQAAYADQLLQDPVITAQVRSVLHYRRENGIARPVTRLRSIT